MATHTISSDDKLVGKIKNCITSGRSCDTPLETDQWVLARIIEGIYRHERLHS